MECPVCRFESKISDNRAMAAAFIECKRCNNYTITNSALDVLAVRLENNQNDRLKLGYALRKVNDNNDSFVLNSDNINSLIQATELPSPPEQLDNLIVFLGKIQNDPGQPLSFGHDDISVVGARSFDNLAYICESARDKGLVNCEILKSTSGYYSINAVSLSMDGWTYFQELLNGKALTKQAFMAMKFNEPDLNEIYFRFKLAVTETGFNLKKLDEEQPAGLIDDRLRVEIRQSRFLIADLTHHNNGAYWEAGFAEGLGRPVIYTCRKDVFDETTTHFDTNHHLTVVWEPEKLDEAASKLKATIRATLPSEAKMND